ncbi:Lysosomal acid phosphatase, partial [Trichinella pseudospiralis]
LVIVHFSVCELLFSCIILSQIKMFTTSTLCRWIISYAVLICCLIKARTVETENTSELIFTHVIYRHGHRNPLGTYPNDPYKEDAWINGYRQLTPYGCQQLYELGQYLRRRYQNLLSNNYTASEIYVRSTDTDRTLCSASCNLAGLFPPHGKQIWNPSILWQPIPIHTVKGKEDHLYNYNNPTFLLIQLLKRSAPCPKYDEVFEKQTKKVTKQINTLYTGLFEYLTPLTGYKNFSIEKTAQLHNSLSLEKQAGMKLPVWADEIWPDPLSGTMKPIIDILENLKQTYKILLFNSPEKARLKFGFLVGTIVEAMREKLNKPSLKPSKMIMYSAHEGTLLGLIHALSISPITYPPFAACYMIELYKDANGIPFVEIHYRNGSNSEAKPVQMPACGDGYRCPWEKFQKVLEPSSMNSIEEVQQACKIRNTSLPNSVKRKFKI